MSNPYWKLVHTTEEATTGATPTNDDIARARTVRCLSRAKVVGPMILSHALAGLFPRERALLLRHSEGWSDTHGLLSICAMPTLSAWRSACREPRPTPSTHHLTQPISASNAPTRSAATLTAELTSPPAFSTADAAAPSDSSAASSSPAALSRPPPS